jgi:hypothetical protein
MVFDVWWLAIVIGCIRAFGDKFQLLFIFRRHQLGMALPEQRGLIGFAQGLKAGRIGFLVDQFEFAGIRTTDRALVGIRRQAEADAVIEVVQSSVAITPDR